jgi:hypothetical protein
MLGAFHQPPCILADFDSHSSHALSSPACWSSQLFSPQRPVSPLRCRFKPTKVEVTTTWQWTGWRIARRLVLGWRVTLKYISISTYSSGFSVIHL